MEFGPGAQPLTPFREDMVFLRGLYHQKAVASTSPHLGRMPNMLSGATVSLDPSEIRVGTTLDQVLAQQIGNQTAVPSMALGIEPNELRLEDGAVDDLRLVALVGLSDQARHQGNLSRSRLSTSWSATARAGSSTAAFSTRCWRKRTRCSRRSSAGDRQEARRVPGIDPRHREAHRPRLARKSGWKAGGRR